MAFQAAAFQSGAFQLAAIGGAGAATFALDAERGATVTYEWLTDIVESLSGLEQRAACRAKPRQTYAWSALLSDAQHRALLSTLAGSAATGQLFLLALPFEDLTVVSSTAGAVTVHSLALCDWAEPGQRVAVVSPAGTVGESFIQSVAGATLGLDDDLSAVALPGARIMPTMGVYLEPTQAIGRHLVRMGRWDLVARAERNGFGATSSSTTVGVGASVTTYDGLPVWDEGIGARFAAQSLRTGAAIVDLGGRISALQAYDRASWGRTTRIESSRPADWQWLKRFLDTIQGRRKAFLLPTGRPDLIPIGDASSGTLTVEGPPVTNAPDYASDWFPSLAHRRLKIVLADGTVAYREVASVASASGSQDLVLDSALAGAIDRVEFLEQVRLESDTVTVTWSGIAFESTLNARVVQR